jgi:hypothetical protein
MKNKGVKSNAIKVKAPQIKVNRKQTNNTSNNLIQSPTQNYYHYYQQKTNKYISEETKNVKLRDYLDPTAYINKNVFTEYDSSPKYSIFPLNSYKDKKYSPNDGRLTYNLTNGNTNKDKNLNLKNKNKLNYNDKAIFKNYTNRDLGKIRKITSYKGNKKISLLQESINNNINSKNNFSRKGVNGRAGPGLYGLKNEIRYPLNNQAVKSKYPSSNPINSKNSENNTNYEQGAIQKIPQRDKIKKYNIIPPAINNNVNKNKKTVRQNKSNITIINKRKNYPMISPDITNDNQITAQVNNSTLNSYYKIQNNKINNYNSCYNFYQKIKNNLHKSNNSYNNVANTSNITNSNNPSVLNTTNNLGYLNSNNSLEESNMRLNSVYSDIYNEDIYENDNINFNYIKTHNNDYRRNLNNHNKRNSVYNNNILYKIQKDININTNHKKGQLSENDTSFNNKRIYKVLNIGNHNKNLNIMKYKKNVIEEFCQILEDFIFMNIKNNFDFFIFKLKEYCKEKHFNNILLKRLQNKNIQKNFYKEKSSSYKYIETNTTNPHYSSIIMMNNSNIINVQRKGDYISNDFTKDYNCGRKTSYNFRNFHSPPLTEKTEKTQKNFRMGKSHDPLDINNINNINIYSNNTYFHNNNLLEHYNNYKLKYDRKRNLDLQMDFDDDADQDK